MPRLVTYECPDCKGQFDFMHHPSDEPAPDRCELCNAWMGDEPEKVPVLHLNFGKEKNRVVDQVYRRMESASIENANQAAEMTGASVSEMSAIKITDLKTNQREGDVAAVAPVSMTKAAQNLSYEIGGHKVGPSMQGSAAAQWGGETRAGREALTTRKVMDSMPHANLAAVATARGSDGKRH